MNHKKILKKLIYSFCIVFSLMAFVLATGLIILYRQQENITKKIIEEANELFIGELTVEESYISPFKRFPYISIDLNQVIFYENKEKSGKPLYEIDDLYLGFDLFDILRGNYNVKTLKVEGGHLDIVQYENGDINVLLAKGFGNDSTETVTDESFRFALENFSISNFELSYHKEANNLHIVSKIDEASLVFRSDKDHIYTWLDTRMIFDILKGEEMSFFHNKHVELHAEMDITQNNTLIKLSTCQLELEKTSFTLKGLIDLANDFMVDLKFKGNKPDFNLFLAFAPADISENIKLSYDNAGSIFFDASLKGKLATGHKPYIEAHFGCKDGYFRNKSINKQVDQLGFNGYFTNGIDSSWQSAELRLTEMTARPGTGVFKGNFVLRNFADPYITMNLYSDLDIEFLSQFLGLKDLEDLSGKVILDMELNELADLKIPENNLVRLKEGVNSELKIINLNFKSAQHPYPIRNMNLHAQMEEGRVDLDRLSFSIGQSDFNISGSVSDLPAIFHRQKKEISFTLKAKSDKIVLKEIIAFDSTAASDEELHEVSVDLALISSVDHLINARPIPKGEFIIRDFYLKLKNYPHTFHDFHADMFITDSTFRLKDFSGEIDETDFHFSGLLSNYHLWFDKTKKGSTQFDFDFHSDKLKLKDLLTYNGVNHLPEDYRDEVISKLRLHGTVDLFYDSLMQAADFRLDYLTGKCTVHPLKLEKFTAQTRYEQGKLAIRNFSGVMGNSDIRLSALISLDSAKSKSDGDYLIIKSSRLDLDQLLAYDENSGNKDHEAVFNIFEVPFPNLKIKAHLDKVNYHKILLENFRADMRIREDHHLFVDSLHMDIAGGHMGINGYFNGSDPKHIYFKSVIDLNAIDIDKVLFKFDNFGQDYSLNENFHGKITGRVSSNIRLHPDLVPVLEDGEASVDISILEGSVVGFAPLQAMATYFQDKNLQMIRFDTLRNHISMNKGIVHIPAMNINSSLGFIEISGKQSLDQKMEYYVRVPMKLVTQAGFKSLFGGKSKEEINPDQVDDIEYRDKDKKISFLNVKITGDSENYKVSLGKDKTAKKIQ